MTEKRFTFADGFKIVAVRDNGEIMNSINVVDMLNELNDENEKLEKKNNAYLQGIEVLKEKNTELQLRNDRQANSLDELYNLIEKEDWKALQQIIQGFRDCEEQLQKEWRKYDR